MDKKQRGTTLIEVLVGLLILVMVMASIFSLIRLSLKLIAKSEVRITASNLASEQIELLRNLPYNKLGTKEGWPKGDIPSSQIKTLNNINYTIKTDIQYIDDPLDGLAPNDLYNADYKKARVWVNSDKYSLPEPVVLVSNFSPKGIEAPEGGGTLIISVIDTATQPVSSADVFIKNTNLNPNINISTKTDGSGKLIVPALPEDSGNNYEIKTTKDGFTQDYTSAITPQMPKPLLPHQTILEGEVTSTTFTIDKVSNLNLHTFKRTKNSPWCDEAYSLRKQLTIKNISGTDAPAGFSVKLSLDHKTLVSTNKSKANGDDIRIFYFNGVNCDELPRQATTDWNADNPTEIWFKTKTNIAAGAQDNSYYLYFSNPKASNPPSDPAYIFNPERDVYTKGLYYFEDKTGATVTDFSANNNHGQINNANWTSGKEGNALEFISGGTPSYVAIPVANDSSLDIINSSLSLEAWVYPTSLSGKQSILDRLYNYALWLDGNKVNFGVFDAAAGMKTVTSNLTLQPNIWVHLAGVYDHLNGALKIYLNNNEDATLAAKINDFVTNNSYDLRFGNGYIAGDLASQFSGKIDGVRISNTFRSNFPFGAPADFSITEGEETSLYSNEPVSNIPLKILGERILGFDADNKGILRNKFENKVSDLGGNLYLTNIEWDNYTISEESPDYDLGEISIPNPIILSPSETKEIDLILYPHQNNTLHITVKDSNKAPIEKASVKLTKVGFEEIKTTTLSGQAFFSPLLAETYNLEVSKDGYITFTETMDISGNVEKEIILSSS